MGIQRGEKTNLGGNQTILNRKKELSLTKNMGKKF